MKILFVAISIIFLLSGCTVNRPRARAAPIQGADSLIVRQVVTNTATRTIVKEPPVKRDTVEIVREVKTIETVTPYFDKEMIKGYLDSAIHTYKDQFYVIIEKQQQEIVFLKTTQASKQVQLEKKLDTTVKEKEIAQEEIAATKKIVYDSPGWIIGLVFLISAIVYLRKKYLKYQQKKIAKLHHPTTHA